MNRLDRPQRPGLARLDPPRDRMAHTLHVQSGDSHAADLNEVSRAYSRGRRRLVCTHARAPETHRVVLGLQLLVQERQEARARDGHLARQSSALLRGAQGASLRRLRHRLPRGRSRWEQIRVHGEWVYVCRVGEGRGGWKPSVVF